MDYNKLIQYRTQVYSRILEYIKRSDFLLSIDYLKDIHRYLFKDIYDSPGTFRVENLRKDEDILYGDSVIYPDYHNILELLTYDIMSETEKNYKLYGMDKTVNNIANFTSRIWQAHPFRDGNTRTVSVFIYNYLTSMGYKIDHDIFKDNSTYLRNALVLANYYNYQYSIHTDKSSINKFFYKLLYDTSIKLDNDTLYLERLNKQKIKKL